MHEAIVGTTVAPTIASCIHPIMVTSTRYGSVPFAPFAGSSEMRVAAAVLITRSSSCTMDTRMYCGVCGVGKYYVGQKP